MHKRSIIFSCMFICLIACKDDPMDDVKSMDEEGMDEQGMDEKEPEAEPETCFTGFTDSQISDNTQIVEDYNQSIHELIACGNITVALCKATFGFIIDVISGTSGGTMPEGIAYGEGGIYNLTSANGVEMSIVFVNGVTSSLGEAGTPIVHNMFEGDNYLIGSDISIDFDGAEIAFDETGPLVELLGFGPNPESPITIPVSLAGLKDIDPYIEDLLVESNILVNDEQNKSVITYNVEMSDGTRFEEVLDNTFSFEVVDASVQRSDLNQVLTNTSWELNFNKGESSTALNGVVAFEVLNGLFDYKGSLSWNNSGFGEALIACL